MFLFLKEDPVIFFSAFLFFPSPQRPAGETSFPFLWRAEKIQPLVEGRDPPFKLAFFVNPPSFLDQLESHYRPSLSDFSIWNEFFFSPTHYSPPPRKKPLNFPVLSRCRPDTPDLKSWGNSPSPRRTERRIYPFWPFNCPSLFSLFIGPPPQPPSRLTGRKIGLPLAALPRLNSRY